MSADTGNVNDYLMNQWYSIIKEWAGDENNTGTRVVFPCIKGTLAPIAGEGIPDAVTNAAIFTIADSLLSLDDQVYTPGSEGSYFGNQSNYFTHVKLQPTDDSPAAQAMLQAAQARVTTLSTQYLSLQTAARNEWKESVEDGDPTDFATFVINNCPQVMDAQEQLASASAQFQQANSNVYGDGAAELNAIQNRFLQLSTNTAVNGYSMQCSTEPFDISGYIKRVQKGEKIKKAKEPVSILNQPLYTYQDEYPQILEQMYKDAQSGTPGGQQLDITVQTGNSSTQSSNGSTTLNQNLGSSWLSFGGSSSEGWSQSSVNSTTGSVRVQAALTDSNLITLTPGPWDVPNYRVEYPNVDASTPASLMNVAKPIGMLIGNGLTLTVTFQGGTRDAFNSEYTQAKHTDGNMSIFGIAIGFSDGPEKKQKETHTASFDPSSGVLIIKPTPEIGSAILLAMVGQKDTSS